MKYSKYFLIIAFFGIVTSCSDFLDRTNPNEPDNVTFWVNEDQLKKCLASLLRSFTKRLSRELERIDGRNCYVGEYY